ncbi:ThuA domain-containing protein [Agromyces allii]|uniref:ThuA-like domain-containing protein n=1 Tax=Agromyces allii TaxID=393607 RepID=A0ABN2QRP9_9MICO|nr:ThuA domain-containing protein [Agromyces allii]
MSAVLIVSGGGTYSDPWHPFDETSGRLVDILGARNDVTLTTDVTQALANLHAGDWDLVVLNFGSAGVALPTDTACVDGILRFSEAGGAILACHVVATAFPGDERWEQILGGRWVRGTSMHPPRGTADISVLPVDHPVTHGHDDFVLVDERYSYLKVSPEVEILATHDHDGLVHPLIWAHSRPSSRVIYDGLGHDAASYDSEEHRALVLSAADWLLEGKV